MEAQPREASNASVISAQSSDLLRPLGLPPNFFLGKSEGAIYYPLPDS